MREYADARVRPVTRAVRDYSLAVLVLVYTFNFIDRQILSILLPSIQGELGFSDTAGGFLTGPAFALFYATLGVPIALYADRGSRRGLITLALAIWSAMTALSGLAQNFVQLAFARIGVGVGEAGCSPPAHSMISDLFPEERRATALSIYSLGIPFGIMFGLFAGGWLDEWFGWRNAFFIVGIPGIVLALIVRLTVPEPRRGASEKTRHDERRYSILDTVQWLGGRASFRYLAFGAGLAAFSGYAIIAWFPTFLSRSLGMSSGEIGTWLGLISGVAGGLGIFLGGWCADRFGNRDARWRLWIVVVAFGVAAPVSVITYLGDTRWIVLATFCVPALLTNFYQATSFAQVQNLVGPRMRGTAAALFLFLINIVGLGAGPLVIGAVSDALQMRFGAESMRYALLGTSAIYLVAAGGFFMAGRHLPADLARVR